MQYKDTSFDQLLGKTLVSVEGATVGSGEVHFKTDKGEQFVLFHSQDCCESVSVEDVIGDPKDLIGEPILEAELVISDDDPPGYTPPGYRDCYTWSFYKVGTRKGSVTFRWLGESNGYYSQEVDFGKVVA